VTKLTLIIIIIDSLIHLYKPDRLLFLTQVQSTHNIDWMFGSTTFQRYRPQRLPLPNTTAEVSGEYGDKTSDLPLFGQPLTDLRHRGRGRTATRPESALVMIWRIDWLSIRI
jgi:hypothetical protein